jgi:hypothetical protein
VFSLRFLKFLLLPLALLIAGEAFAAQIPSREDAVHFLSGLKEQNTVRLQETDKAIDKKLDETKDTRVVGALHNDIEKLRSDRQELLLRQDFLDRLILKTDSKYDGAHPREFLDGALKSMAQVEINSSSPTTMWPFLDNLRRLILRLPGQQDRTFHLVEGYMKATSIAHPMLPDEFMKKIAYSNGSQTEGAHPMDRTEVGEFADKRIKQLQAQENHMKMPESSEPTLTPVTTQPPAETQAPAANSETPVEKTAN